MFIDDIWTVELVMKMFVNTSGLPLNSTKSRLDGRISGGSETDMTSHPYQIWPLRCSPVWRYVWGIWTKQTVCVCNDKIIIVKTDSKNPIYEPGCGCVQQRRYRWLNRRKLLILYCYLLLHQLHRTFIAHWLVASNCLTANNWTTSIYCRRSNQLI
jgi:hypothetical protein